MSSQRKDPGVDHADDDFDGKKGGCSLASLPNDGNYSGVGKVARLVEAAGRTFRVMRGETEALRCGRGEESGD